VTGVIAGLMQGRTGVFAEWMQGRHLYVLGYLASVFGNSVSMLIATLGLSGYSNGYRATVAVIRNNYLIKWAGWLSEYNSYESANYLTNTPSLS
jgi:hypothetical protein